MRLSLKVYSFLVLGCFCPGISSASSDVELEHKLLDLTARVAELERRLSALESPKTMQLIEKNTVPVNPGDRLEQLNWNRLKVGYNYDEVRELVGEPIKIKKGSMEFWYYSERQLEGPFVKFIFQKVHSWESGLDQ